MSVFKPNAGKCRPEITPYLDTFHAVYLYRKIPTTNISSTPNYMLQRTVSREMSRKKSENKATDMLNSSRNIVISHHASEN